MQQNFLAVRYRIEEHAVELELGEVGVGLVRAVHHENHRLRDRVIGKLTCVFT